MKVYIWLGTLLIASGFSLYFSILTYSLRDFSRTKLADHLGRHDGDKWFESLTEQTRQYVFVTAVFRMLFNLMTWVGMFELTRVLGQGRAIGYGEAVILSAIVSLAFSIVAPTAIAHYAAEAAIGYSAPLLSFLRLLLSPLTPVMDITDNAVRRALGVEDEIETEQIEQEILSAVEEGEREGVVDEQERELIENVIEFRDTTAGHIMTARSEIVALESAATLEETRAAIESSGNSRLPVYEETLDKVVGILYARDLIKFLGQSDQSFKMRSVLRPAMFVPETKPLRNLLNDFRQQKVHLAIVLDEYGGTAGLVTIEDVLEELVGEISDEHEPIEPAMFRKTGDASAEADARLGVIELNREMGLDVPSDAGYETLGGYLMTAMGRIPERGAVFEGNGAKFTVLDAEPRKINRVRIELLAPQAGASDGLKSRILQSPRE